MLGGRFAWHGIHTSTHIKAKGHVMKKSFRYLIIGLLGCSNPGLFNASADLEVSAAVQIRATAEFHEPLSPHGVWVEVGPYGRCWHPAHVAASRRAPCYGQGGWAAFGR